MKVVWAQAPLGVRRACRGLSFLSLGLAFRGSGVQGSVSASHAIDTKLQDPSTAGPRRLLLPGCPALSPRRPRIEKHGRTPQAKKRKEGDSAPKEAKPYLATSRSPQKPNHQSPNSSAFFLHLHRTGFFLSSSAKGVAELSIRTRLWGI